MCKQSERCVWSDHQGPRGSSGCGYGPLTPAVCWRVCICVFVCMAKWWLCLWTCVEEDVGVFFSATVTECLQAGLALVILR